MAICVNCGVELEEGMKICPLCGRPPDIKSEIKDSAENYPTSIIRLNRKENRKYLWELTGIVAFSGIAVCTIVDIIISKKLSWSLYSDTFILAGWVILTLFIYSYKRLYILVPGILLTLLAGLFLVDLFSPGRNWFFRAGLPITVAAFITAGTIIILYRSANFKGLNIIASALIVLSGFCIVTEMALDNLLNGLVDLRWSLIAAISIFSVSLILFFYHYRLKKGNRLDRFFHV